MSNDMPRLERCQGSRNGKKAAEYVWEMAYREGVKSDMYSVLRPIASGRRGACLGFCGAAQIERRPRGASRAALAPTFVFGQ